MLEILANQSSGQYFNNTAVCFGSFLLILLASFSFNFSRLPFFFIKFVDTQLVNRSFTRDWTITAQ